MWRQPISELIQIKLKFVEFDFFDWKLMRREAEEQIQEGEEWAGNWNSVSFQFGLLALEFSWRLSWRRKEMKGRLINSLIISWLLPLFLSISPFNWGLFGNKAGRLLNWCRNSNPSFLSLPPQTSSEINKFAFQTLFDAQIILFLIIITVC